MGPILARQADIRQPGPDTVRGHAVMARPSLYEHGTPIMIPHSFEHQRSALVDVFPKPDGEFVQVWDSPRSTVGRKLLLTYFRSASGPSEITHRVTLDEGPFQMIETSGSRRTFFYRGKNAAVRQELFLPSGRLLVSDPLRGLSVRAVFTRDFDWSAMIPRGRPLGDRAVIKLQDGGETYFVST